MLINLRDGCSSWLLPASLASLCTSWWCRDPVGRVRTSTRASLLHVVVTVCKRDEVYWCYWRTRVFIIQKLMYIFMIADTPVHRSVSVWWLSRSQPNNTCITIWSFSSFIGSSDKLNGKWLNDLYFFSHTMYFCLIQFFFPWLLKTVLWFRVTYVYMMF